ncbi:class I SAM-dependent methyltransferase [Thermithiobacillus plumbiphilus]|uniref:Methyltransferase domain-containing protein n=1 Tax=Thermithiobacillus plumbiphilus TaxID=1729899 RepID=A0ABU9D5Z0_9PROT
MKRFFCPMCNLEATQTSKKLGGYSIYKCEDCSLRFAPDAFNVEVSYTSIYDTQEYVVNHVNMLHNTIDKKYFSEIITYQPFFNLLKDPKGKNLLDVGCGVGRFCHAAHSLGWNVRGIDISARAVEIGNAYANFALEKCTIEEMAARNVKFDVITSFEVVEHLVNPLSFLNTCKKMLKPGGKVFLTVPNWHCEQVQNSTHRDWNPPIHLCFYTEKALIALVEKSGLVSIASGIIWSDAKPRNSIKAAKWLVRRIMGRKNEPLGLWVCASNSEL